MLRYILIIAVAAGLVWPAGAGAAPAEDARKPVKAKRHVARHTKGYGFLPGYEPPVRENLYGERLSWAERRYWDWGWRYGYGGPRFYRGQWNGGGFGPCWTDTPIGPVWNCGK